MPVIEVKQLDIPCLKLGEGPHWEAHNNALLFVECHKKNIRRHFVDTGRHQVLHVDDDGEYMAVTFAIPVEGSGGDLLVIGLGNTVAVVRWSPSSPSDELTVKATNLTRVEGYHLNDAKCDPQGRLWAGTISPFDSKCGPLELNTGALYRIDHKLVSTTWLKVTLSNGLAWSPDKKRMYYIDSQPLKCVYRYDYDDATGDISNQRVLLDYTKTAGLEDQFPDGMTTDVDGNLWVACMGGGQVICVDPDTGDVLRSVSLPPSPVASMCWGGPDYSTLFVTTGTITLSQEQIAASPQAGATFAITGLGTRGYAPYNYKIDREILKKLVIE